MSVPAPHFLLFSESSRRAQRCGDARWRFVLESVDGGTKLEAADAEPGVQGERLELLAVVRGLEALPEPARVTLITPSQYVRRGLLFGLEEWRANGWQWERFGRQVPVRDSDLWQRLAHALRFHNVQCRTWRLDASHDDLSEDRSPRPTAGDLSARAAQAAELAGRSIDPAGRADVGACAAPVRGSRLRRNPFAWLSAGWRGLSRLAALIRRAAAEAARWPGANQPARAAI
jgi:ribonuclease HI